MLHPDIKNEIINMLTELGNTSTDITINKYDLFKTARKTVCDNWDYGTGKEYPTNYYKNVKQEVDTIIKNWVIENKYELILKTNPEFGYIEYFVITEQPTSDAVILDKRNRVTIPANIVKTAGLKPGDKVYGAWDIAKNDNTNIEPATIYFNINDNPTDATKYTVEKSGIIRVTLPELYGYTFNPQIKVIAINNKPNIIIGEITD